MIEAVTYGGTRPPAKAIAGRMRAEPQRSFFRRFIDALKESRSREARRVIAKFAHLRHRTVSDIDAPASIGKP